MIRPLRSVLEGFDTDRSGKWPKIFDPKFNKKDVGQMSLRNSVSIKDTANKIRNPPNLYSVLPHLTRV